MASESEFSRDWETAESSGDDDMDFELATEESQTTSQEDDDEDGEDGEDGATTLYIDEESGTIYAHPGVRVQVDDEEENDEDDDEEEDEEEDNNDDENTGTQTPRAAPDASVAEAQRVITISQQHLFQLLRSAGIHGIFQSSRGPTTRSQARRGNAQHMSLDEEAEEEEDEDDFYSFLGHGGRRRRRQRSFVGERWPKVPSEEGTKLMASGSFGTNDRCDHSACGRPFDEEVVKKRRRLSRRLLDRELGTGSYARTQALSKLSTQDLIPGSKADMIVNYDARCYSGQFSEDGSFYFACGQDFRVHMYDTSNPYDWRYYKTVRYLGGQWTITDASLSPDNKLLAYSSIRSTVCLARTDPSDASEPQMLNFGNSGFRNDGGHFGIWSLRFSGDGSEIVAGTSDQSVYVYDLEAQRSILRIEGHTDDVNAVCFGDKMSPHILYSGSDDTTLKIWDRRSLSSMRPAGLFLGHTEGLTYVDSKGDGRYVISNGKDQTCKLWDLRHMISTDVGEKLDPRDFSTGFDYRYATYDQSSHEPHPHDCSLVTFRGHRVLKTLIRCHFSPALSTDQRYVYSGSLCGKIWVWNLDGTKRETIDVLAATKNPRARDNGAADRYGGSGAYDWSQRSGAWKTIVRDCSWHPSAPVIAATSWNGPDHDHGTCTVHSWTDGANGDEVDDLNDEPRRSLGSTPMGAKVTARLVTERAMAPYISGPGASTRESRRARSLRSRLRMGLDDMDEDE